MLVGALLIAFARRLAHDRGAPASEGFSLQQLRDMHARGVISDAEFDQAKAKMIGRMTGRADAAASPAGETPEVSAAPEHEGADDGEGQAGNHRPEGGTPGA